MVLKDRAHCAMAYLSLVHEEQEVPDNLLVGILEDDDGVFFGQVSEQVVKVVGTRGQHDPVSRHRLPVGAGQADIHQSVAVQQLLEAAQRVQAVVVPLEVELLGRLHNLF